MRIIYLCLIGVLIIGGGLIWRSSVSNTNPDRPLPASDSPNGKTVPSPEVVDYKASFAIFTNGTFRIFTAAMYHNLSPDAFITAEAPNVVTVKKAGTRWNDFFATLPFTLTSECLTTGTGETYCSGQGGTLVFYLNGAPVSDALTRVIVPGDRLLVTFGTHTDDSIQSQLRQIPQSK